MQHQPFITSDVLQPEFNAWPEQNRHPKNDQRFGQHIMNNYKGVPDVFHVEDRHEAFRRIAEYLPQVHR